MNKKYTWFTMLAILVLIGTSISGCAPQAETPVVQPTTEVPTETEEVITPPEKTQIVVVIAEDPPSFNAAINQSGFDVLVMELTMLGLADFDEQGNAFAELAAELPSIENGGAVIDEEAGTLDVTWKLRQDIKWSDGVPVTADDIVFTYEAVVDPEGGYWIPGIDYVDGVEKIDDYTVVVHYNTVFPGYLTQFGGYLMAVWPAHYCDPEQGFINWDCGMEPISNGPYILEEWVHNDHLTFVRNPDYFEAGKPTIDEIVMQIIPDEAIRKQMLIKGDADLDMWTPENVIAELEGVTNVEVSLSPVDRWVMRIFFNLVAKGTTDPEGTPHPVLSDLRVRKAIQMAVDIETIRTTFFHGFADKVWTEVFRPPYNICDIPEPAFDPEGAKVLLEEAGWIDQDGDGVRECHGCETGAEDGYVMEMEFITYAEYGEALDLTQEYVAENLGDIGIDLNLTKVEGTVLWEASENGGIEQSGNFDMDIWDDGYSGNDPIDYLWGYYYSEAAIPDYGLNYGRYVNEEIDELIDNSYTLDEEVRKENFCRMAEILAEELPELILFTTVDANAHSTRLQGVVSNANEIVTWNAADWTLK